MMQAHWCSWTAFLAMTAAAFTGPVMGQPDLKWFQRQSVNSPSARVGHAMVFDASRGRTVLFGGLGANLHNDTWEWDGSNWIHLSPALSPPPRQMHAMAFDSSRGRTVLFGGQGTSSTLNDTWEWDGANWLPCQPASVPPCRQSHAMAFDSARGRTLLFGGIDNFLILADTWEWDGTNWVQRQALPSPSQRFRHAMAFEANRQRTLLFGGQDASNLRDDTWAWDGSCWTSLSPIFHPPARSTHAMAFDSKRNRILMFGGRILSGPMVAETWEWNGAFWYWLQPATPPSPPYMPTMAFDSARNRFVTFESNTWQLEYTWLGTITTIGQSCKGSNGKLPSLWPLRTPQFNTNFELCLTEGPPRQGWILFLHPSQSFLDLGPHGAPGCAGYLTPGFLIAHVGFLSAAGHANPAPLFTVSNDLNLLGGSFHAQAFIHDPNANPAGWITTNGLKILVGY